MKIQKFINFPTFLIYVKQKSRGLNIIILDDKRGMVGKRLSSPF